MITIKLKAEATKRNSFRSLADRIMKDQLQKTLIPQFRELLGDLACDETTHETYVNEIFITEDGNTIELAALCCQGFRNKVLLSLSAVPQFEVVV